MQKLFRMTRSCVKIKRAAKLGVALSYLWVVAIPLLLAWLVFLHTVVVREVN